MKKTLLVLCLSLQCIFAKSVSAIDLKLLSWNTMLLPFPISISYQKIRTKEIVRSLKEHDADVVVLQEVFIPSKRKYIQKSLKAIYPHQAFLGVSNDFFTILSSGVVILSKFPIEDKKSVYFKSSNFFSADRFSSKGALLTQLLLPNNKRVQVIGTHLQASQTAKNRKVRINQLKEIFNLAKSQRQRSTDQFLIGDLNIDAYNGADMDFMFKNFAIKTFPLQGDIHFSHGDHDISCFTPLGSIGSSSTPQLLDHVWQINPPATSSQSSSTSKDYRILNFQGMIKKKKCALSDHLPLSVVLNISP